jgi:hypothetical protein
MISLKFLKLYAVVYNDVLKIWGEENHPLAKNHLKLEYKLNNSSIVHLANLFFIQLVKNSRTLILGCHDPQGKNISYQNLFRKFYLKTFVTELISIENKLFLKLYLNI